MSWRPSSGSTRPSATGGRSTSWPGPSRCSPPGRRRPGRATARPPSGTGRSAGSRSNSTGWENQRRRSADRLRPPIDPGHADLSVRRQCQWIGRSRATHHRGPAEESAGNLAPRRLIGEPSTACPSYGSRRIARWLARNGREGNRNRVRRLPRPMGLAAIHPKPKLPAGRGHTVYPDPLRDVPIDRAGPVWPADSPYLPMAPGVMGLAAAIDSPPTTTPGGTSPSGTRPRPRCIGRGGQKGRRESSKESPAVGLDTGVHHRL